jgi:hypothetical protein
MENDGTAMSVCFSLFQLNKRKIQNDVSYKQLTERCRAFHEKLQMMSWLWNSLIKQPVDQLPCWRGVTIAPVPCHANPFHGLALYSPGIHFNMFIPSILWSHQCSPAFSFPDHTLCTFLKLNEQGGAVGIATGYALGGQRVGIRVLLGARFFTSPRSLNSF